MLTVSRESYSCLFTGWQLFKSSNEIGKLYVESKSEINAQR